jgi:hypothetical protein
MTYRGRVTGGVIVLEEGAALPDGAEVRVDLVESSAPEPHPLLKILDLAADAGIADLSVNADHYLYGHPKVSDEPNARTGVSRHERMAGHPE